MQNHSAAQKNLFVTSTSILCPTASKNTQDMAERGLVTVSQYLKEWTDDPVKNVLAGMVGTFALIPEVIAFSYAAGVAPAVGLFASFVISIAIAITGGRPGMISRAAGSVALDDAALVHS